MRWWGADENKHIFYEVGLRSTDTCQCRRTNCWLHERRPWSYFKRYSKVAYVCKGDRFDNEMATAYTPEVAISVDVMGQGR